MDKVDIILIARNNIEEIKRCIHSITTYTTTVPYELIVVDNNATDEIKEWLQKNNEIKLICNEKEQNQVACYNKALTVSKDNHKLLLESNFIATPFWLNQLMDELLKCEDIYLVGCEVERTPHQNICSEVLHIGQGCVLMRNNTTEKIKFFDERYIIFELALWDLCLEVSLFGGKNILYRNIKLYEVSISNIFSADEWEKNKQLFKQKWGFQATYSMGVSWYMIDKVKRSPKASFHVLEVGCACGANLLEIKQRYKNATVYGIEINKGAAKIANTFCDVKDCNVEDEGSIDYPDHFFDFILFGDVLEHLYDPAQTLKNVRRILKPSGKIIMSIPNISHYTAIYAIMNGNFTYEDSGLFDRTHIRFFTLNEIKKLIANTGYKALALESIVPFSSEQMGKDDALFLDALVSFIGKEEMRKQYMAFQYVVMCQKDNQFVG